MGWGTRTHSAVDRCHVAGIRVDVSRGDGHLGLRDQLLVVVSFQVPDVDGTALVTHNELRLGYSAGEEGRALACPAPGSAQPCVPPHLVGVQAHTVNGCIHLEDPLTLQVPGPSGWGTYTIWSGCCWGPTHRPLPWPLCLALC